MDNRIIEKYLANELSPEERNAFEQEMEADDFLKEAVEGLEALKVKQPEISISSIQEETEKRINLLSNKSKKGKLISISAFKMAAAACIIGLLCFISFRLFLNNQPVNEQEIYASYFKPLTHPDGNVRGENNLSDEKLAVESYEKEDYFEAVNYYQQLVKEHPRNVKNNLFYGISLLATNQPKKAIEVLNKITTSEEYHYDIHWYLALAYIKNKELDNAQKTLKALVDEENYYQKKAKEISAKLNGHLASAK